MKKTDILIIGAGPAGLIAAKNAAERDIDVLTIDRKSVIGHPVRCGEGIPDKILFDFGLEYNEHWVKNKAHVVRLFSPEEKMVRFKMPKDVEVYILDREAMEQELCRRAQKAGAVVRMSVTAVGMRTDGRSKAVVSTVDGDGRKKDIRARIVIAADGVESLVGHWAGLSTRLHPRDIGSCVQHTIEHKDIDDDTIDFYFGGKNAPKGYSWVFPKGEGVANVGLGVLGMDGGKAMKALDKFMGRKFKGYRSTRFTVGCVPVADVIKKSVKGNVLLVGDAARFVIALTGAGLGNALISGTIAGEVAADNIRANQDISGLMEYERRWREALGKKLTRSYKWKTKVLKNNMTLERYFYLLRFIFGLYKLAPGFVLNRIGSDFHYTSSR